MIHGSFTLPDHWALLGNLSNRFTIVVGVPAQILHLCSNGAEDPCAPCEESAIEG